MMKSRVLAILCILAAFCAFSCGEKEPAGSSYTDIFGNKDKDQDQDQDQDQQGGGQSEGYVRQVEQAEDTYDYPKGGALEIYSPSLAVHRYNPITIKYKSGDATAISTSTNLVVPGGKVTSWTTDKARIVHYLQNYEAETKTYEKYKTLTNKWGSTLTKEKRNATGRFRTEKIDGRWWIIDPDGYVHYERGVTSFRHGSSNRNKTAFTQRFGDNDQTWIAMMQKELAQTGIHATGAFCTNAYTPMVTYNNAHPDDPLVLCPSFGFLSKFRSAKNGGKWPGGSDAYEATLVLHPDWTSWCREYVAGSEFSNYRNNRFVLGFFSDNEINFTSSLLKSCLGLTDANDIAKKGAVEFMQS